jgi:hypothetical protein
MKSRRWTVISAQGHSAGGGGCGPHTSRPTTEGARHARSGPWPPCTGPPWWRSCRCPAGRQGAEAPVGVARVGEGKGAEHSYGSGRSSSGWGDGGAGEKSWRGGASQRQGCSRELRWLRGWPRSSEREMRR